jgi:hypothetical protein
MSLRAAVFFRRRGSLLTLVKIASPGKKRRVRNDIFQQITVSTILVKTLTGERSQLIQ